MDEVKRRVSLSRPPPNDMTPLHIACFFENVKVAQLLVASSANINAVDSDNLLPLHIASMRGNMELVALLDTSSSGRCAITTDGFTPAQVSRH